MWDDGTSAKQNVTLTGREGEVLKLKAGDIPSVGQRPIEGYEAGSWNQVPDTQTAITEDKVYTYTYAKKTDPVRTVNMFRMYNPNSGEHFYTGNQAERDTLVQAGWKYEGIGFYTAG